MTFNIKIQSGTTDINKVTGICNVRTTTCGGVRQGSELGHANQEMCMRQI